jgi:hypothetical protein
MGHYSRVTQVVGRMRRRPGRKLEKLRRRLAQALKRQNQSEMPRKGHTSRTEALQHAGKAGGLDGGGNLAQSETARVGRARMDANQPRAPRGPVNRPPASLAGANPESELRTLPPPGRPAQKAAMLREKASF